MREIKFRAISKRANHMVFGSLETNNIYHKYAIAEGGCIIHSVLEDTIGQFTGHKDQNGKEIYEGDVLSELVEVDGEVIQGNYPVFLHDELHVWCIDVSFKKNRKTYYFLHEQDLNEFYVSGNVHQDAALLTPQ